MNKKDDALKFIRYGLGFADNGFFIGFKSYIDNGQYQELMFKKRNASNEEKRPIVIHTERAFKPERDSLRDEFSKMIL